MRDQSQGMQNMGNNDRAANTEEMELQQHLYDLEQEQEQVTARDPSRAIELEKEVRRLAQVIDDMQ